MVFHGMRNGLVDKMLFMTIFGLVLQLGTARVCKRHPGEPVPGTCYDVNGNQVPDGYYEDPANCRKFYACGGGFSYHMDCGAGTIYNPESKNCDINDDGRVCTSQKSLEPATMSMGIKSLMVIIKTQFYACGGGIAYRMDCGAGTVYNPESRSCDIHDEHRVCT